MTTLDLSGIWNVRQRGEHTSIPATVPGGIHHDLQQAGRIPDPYVADHEKNVQWVGESDWIYEKTFSLAAGLPAHDRVLLRAEGLDTLATLTLNGTLIGTTDNMFRTWEFDVKALLRVGENRLVVQFASAAAYVKARAAARPADQPLPQWKQPGSLSGSNFIRKEQCNFGWDWGPCLVTCGIWRPIRIVAFNTARLGEVHVRQDHTAKNTVGLDIDVTAQAASRRAAGLRARLRVSFGETVAAETEIALPRGRGCTRVVLSNPRLWWPNGLGEAALHTVSVDLLDAAGTVLDGWARRIGLRTLRLDRHPDEWGESFQFTVNGMPFFAKGANWIPADAVLARLTRADYERLLADTAAVHMNMLRVWGGGTYEDDAFYDLCDELGICIWQDFMFACAAYETPDAAFRKNVRAEAEDNVRRLRHHACLALWCGNNEMEMGLVGEHWYHPPRHTRFCMSWKDYGRVFDTLLPDVIASLDPERDYWPASPHTPPPHDRSSSNDPRAGDAHLWEVWHGRKPFEWYRTCNHRFNSEFGFQSFPEPRTLEGVIPDGERNITGSLMEHHQRSQIGNTAIMQYMLDWFRMPKDFDATLWLSQILQGNAIKYAVEHWRRSMPRGMGTLYWQLNDCWPVASWASIDYAGRWKALHYMARRFFAPCLVSGLENRETGTVELHVTSDRPTPAKGVISWRATDAAGSLLKAGTVRVAIPAGADVNAAVLDFKRELGASGEHDLLLWLELQVGGETVSTNLVTFARPKHLRLQAPTIAATVSAAKDGAFEVALTAPHPALWCWLELEGTDARWSDRFFHLEAGKPATLRCHPASRLTLAAFRRQLRIRSLIDTWEG